MGPVPVHLNSGLPCRSPVLRSTERNRDLLKGHKTNRIVVTERRYRESIHEITSVSLGPIGVVSGTGVSESDDDRPLPPTVSEGRGSRDVQRQDT